VTLAISQRAITHCEHFQGIPGADSAGWPVRGEGVDKRDDLSNSIAAADESEPRPNDASNGADSAEAGSGEHGDQEPDSFSRLAPGASVASYRIMRVLRTAPEETVYLAVQPQQPSSYAEEGA